MARFNLVTWDRCNTIGETVKEYKRLSEEIFPGFMDAMDELRHSDPSGKYESVVNRIMTDAILDMETARDLFRRHDEMVQNMFGQGYESYVKKMGVI